MANKTVKHPYFPQDAELPHYKENVTTMAELLGIFFGLNALLIIGLLVLTKRKSVGDRVKVCWFVSSGLIHIILEGYFSLYYETLAGEDTYLAQLWKEYGKGDSRYVMGEHCMVAVESVTTFFDGPLCLLTALALFSPSLYSYRYVFQLVVSLCQLYGDTIFFFTEILAGFKHSIMWHPLYFWFYFFFLNSIWIFIPSIFIIDACIHIVRAQGHLDSKKVKSN